MGSGEIKFPKSWQVISVADAVINVSTNGIKIPQKQYLPNGVLPVVDQGQDYIGGYTDNLALKINCDLPVIVFGDHTRIVKYINIPFAPGADGIKVLQPQKFFQPRLLSYYIQYLTSKLTNYGYARHYQHLSKEILAVPPIPEQRRIVAKIEELFSELDKGIENLKTARAQLKIYRQALLKDAFEGKLTAYWREQNKDKLETASALQQRIQAERAARYQQQLKEWEANDKQGSKPKAPKPLPPLTDEDLAELPTLPEAWGWVKLSEVCEKITDGDHQAPPQTKDGIPFITISDIKNQKIDFSDTRYVSSNYYESLSEERKPIKNDILYTVTGSFGIPSIVDFDRQFCFQRHIGLIRADENIYNKFLFYLLSSKLIYNQAFKVATGTAQKTVSLGGLRLFRTPLASYAEQQEIVMQLEMKLSELEQLDQTITTALQKSEALRQSILKKAFSGTLVLQDANDEPASILLESIKNGKQQLSKGRAN